MKKLLLIAFLTLAMVLTLVACSGNDQPAESTPESAGESTPADETDESAPVESETDPAPVESETDPKPIESETDPAPVESETDPKPVESETDPAPVESETDPKPVESETEPEPVETVNPNAPTVLYPADQLTENKLNAPNDMELPTLSEDGTYITVTPTGSDPYYYPLAANTIGDRYVAIKYRTSNAAGTTMQIYIGSGKLDNDNDMLKHEIITDGEWHLAIFDAMKVNEQLVDAITGQEGAAGEYDGSKVAFFRFDVLECNYVLNDQGVAYQENKVWVREPMVEGAYIDVAYVAFFDTEEKAMLYEYGTTNPDDDNHNFQSDIANQSGDFLASDLVTGLFAAGSPESGTMSWFDVLGMGENAIADGAYLLKNYNEMFTQANGKYAYSATIEDLADSNRCFMFVRGVRAFSFGDNGYFGNDGDNNYAGCGGINVAVKNNVLTITIRSYTGGACIRNIYNVPVDSNKITLADDGETVYIMAGDKLVATIEISGTRDFGYSGVAADACADKVVLTLAGQEPVEIADAVVAASHKSDLGMAIREVGNYIKFSALSLVGFSTVEIPEMVAPETPEDIPAVEGEPENPVKVIGAVDLAAAAGLNNVVITPGDGYTTFTFDGTVGTPGNDPYCNLVAGYNGARYVAVKYRAPEISKGMNLQIYVGSGNLSNDDQSLQQVITADGEWHILIFDLDELVTKMDENYKVSFLRLDALQAGIKYNEDGTPVVPDPERPTTYEKLPIPEGASIDVAYIAFFTPKADEPDEPFEHDYVTEGLVSLYNGGEGTTWADRINGYDVTIAANDTNYLTSDGLYIDSTKQYFPAEIVELVKGNAFTIEIAMSGFHAHGTPYATILNDSAPEVIALFLQNDGTNDLISFKCCGLGGSSRPALSTGAQALLAQDITITVTMDTATGKVALYINGALVSEKDGAAAMTDLENLYIGHDQTAENAPDSRSKAWKALIRSVRFYNVALSADAIAQNYTVDSGVESGTPPETSVDTTVEGATSTIIANDMLGADKVVNDQYGIQNYKDTFQTNKNLFTVGFMENVAVVSEDGVVFTHYPMIEGKDGARILFKTKYMSLVDNTDYIGTQYIVFRYRTNMDTTGQLFAGYEAGQSEANLTPTAITWEADGQWHICAIKASVANENMINVLNLTVSNAAVAADDYFDLDYIAFYADEASWKAAAGIVDEPETPADDTHNFTSDIASQSGNFLDSDLVTEMFAAGAPNSGTMSWYDVIGTGGNAIADGAYLLKDYNEMFTQANGAYAYSATIVDTPDPNRCFMFVRGVRAFNFADAGYFGHDGDNNYAGCGGIQAMVKDGVLTILIRSYTDGTCVRNTYTVNVDSNKITFADNGSTVYIMAGDKLVATIEISGTRDFGYSGVAADACADKVVLTLAGQESVEIKDAVVAASYKSDLGMAIREVGNYIKFSELSVQGFSTVEIPALASDENGSIA